MTRTQLLDARRNVQKELVAFLSIVIIGMLATLSYLSVTYSSAALKQDALTFFNTCRLWDLEVASTMLMDEDDLEAIRALPGVASAERVWQIDAKLLIEADDSDVTLISTPQSASLPRLLEGRLPESPEECALEKTLADRCGLTPGQRVSVECKPISDVDPLLVKDYVITGVFQSPDHITYMVPATPYMIVCEDSFNREGLEGAFMKIRVRVEGAPEDRYSDAYWEAVTPVEDAIRAMADERASLRVEKMRASLDEKLEEGRGKLRDAERQLEDGRRQLADGRAELEAKRIELEDARQKLADGRAEYEDGCRQLADARQQLDEGRKALEDAERQLSEMKALLDAGGAALVEAEYQLSSIPGIYTMLLNLLRELESIVGHITLPGELGSMRQQLEDGFQQYGEGRMLWYSKGEAYLDAATLFEKNKKLLEQREGDYADAQKKLADIESQLAEGEKQLAEGEQALLDAERQLADAEKELADGEAQYRDGVRALREAEEIRDKLGIGRWVVLNDKGNPGFIYAEVNYKKLASLSMTFSSIFLVVGAMVIYATIGRMVEQQRKLIGATKAMGLYNREIFAKYLYFACAAVALGTSLGVLLARFPLQNVILRSYAKFFTYGEPTSAFLPLETGVVAAGALAVSVAAVYLGCGALLRLPAIRLMQGASPSGGRKKARSSAQRSLYTRLIFRNMRMDRTRVLVTTVSIAGGCMLMVIGFTLRYGISGVPDRQFGGIQTYEAEVFFDPGINADAAAEIEKILDENALPYIAVRKAGGVFEADDTLNAMTMIVADNGALEGFFTLRDLSGAPLELKDSGALVPRRFSEYYSLGIGDAVTVYDSGMNLNEVTIAGVFENYYGQLFFMSPRGYEEIFLSAPEQNCFFVKTGGMGLDALRQKLENVEGFVKLSDAFAERHVIEQFTAALNYVVWLMLFIAGMMSCFIVANFSMTYIQRKTRELTIMRINGFSAGECTRYAAVDLIVTTVVGTGIGLVLGGFVGRAVLATTETPYIQMIRESALQSYLYSALITCGFSALTNSFALRKIKKLKLSDID